MTTAPSSPGRGDRTQIDRSHVLCEAGVMICPLCRQRKARRLCPALNQEICSVCCGTKRLVEVRCPADCPYLASARSHPPAVVHRQRQRDLQWLAPMIREFNEEQSRLFFTINTWLSRYRAGDFERLVDEDIAQAAGALAATLETAARGVIYEHRPTSAVAERLGRDLRQALDNMADQSGRTVQRHAPMVLRQIEQAARATPGGSDTAYLASMQRILKELQLGTVDASSPEAASTAAADSSRIVLP